MSTPIRGYSQESGIVYIDKSMNWRSLYVVGYMNNNQPIYYSLLFGDKDTFFLSFGYMKKPYTFVPHSPFLAGKRCGDLSNCPLSEERKNQSVGYSFVQLDMDGRAFCVHLVSGKKRVFSYLEQNKKPFDIVLPIDPNWSHFTGIGSSSLVVTLDATQTTRIPDISAAYAFGPFEEQLKASFEEAKHVLSRGPSVRNLMLLFFFEIIFWGAIFYLFDIMPKRH